MARTLRTPVAAPRSPLTAAEPGGLAIEVEGLVKEYRGGRAALDGVSFSVVAGQTFGLLGPNGSGKTTTVRILVTLLRQTSGRAAVGGFDVDREPEAVRRVIGYAGQFVGVDDDLTGLENLALQGIVHGISHRDSWTRAKEVLEAMSLGATATMRAGRLSGGQRRRLDVAQALVHRPAVVFLDEPTTGLDIQSRAGLWEELHRLGRDYGTTVFLTTQYLEEADRACDRVAILDAGRVVKQGAPSELKDQVGGGRLLLGFGEPPDGARARRLLEGLPGVIAVTEGDPLVVSVADAHRDLLPVLAALGRGGIEPASVEQAQVSLDDVFLAYTGRQPRSEAPQRGATSGIFAVAHGRRGR
jgi:ABC-2 type transport system ATP-binding protein